MLHEQAYALKRLARGLASGRGAARQGFALALTGALAALPAVPVAPVLDLLDAALDAPNSMKARALHSALAAWHGCCACRAAYGCSAPNMCGYLMCMLTRLLHCFSRALLARNNTSPVWMG